MPRVNLCRKNRVEEIRENREQIIRQAMSRSRLYSQKDLANLMHMNEASISCRMSGKAKWKVDELNLLDRIIHFTDDELANFIRAK